MIYSHKASFSIVFGLVLAFAAPAFVSSVSVMGASLTNAYAMGGAKPLVIVRFNQRKVYFEQPLYSAVSKAVQVKPDVTFRLVSYVPRTGDERKDQSLMNEASQHTRQIADSMVQMGIPMQRISVVNEMDPSLRHDETHIFVQ